MTFKSSFISKIFEEIYISIADLVKMTLSSSYLPFKLKDEFGEIFVAFLGEFAIFIELKKYL